LTFKELKKVSR